jgi:hypothetical protein
MILGDQILDWMRYPGFSKFEVAPIGLKRRGQVRIWRRRRITDLLSF